MENCGILANAKRGETMEKIYIFGHQKPDTDSVCASISLSYLKNQLGYNTIPKVLGHINQESKYVLDYFGVKEPEYLNDVKVQIRNMKYNKNAIINEKASIYDAFQIMQKEEETGICIVDENKKLKGLITLKDLARQLVVGDKNNLHTTLFNVMKVLNAEIVLQNHDEIHGSIVAASYKSQTILEEIAFSNQHILIVGDRYRVLEYAIESNVQLIIMTGGSSLPEDLFEKAKQKKISILCTSFDTYTTSNSIVLANSISTILEVNDPITVNSLDYRTDFLELSEKLGHTNYPVVNKSHKCLGLLKINEVNQYERLKIILVDHNGFRQSVDGIEEAVIEEIIDHHNLLNVGTPTPINFRSMPVGCTCTIIYHMFIESGIPIPREIAGLMLSAILSDTLLLRSVTATEEDKRVVEKLAEIANIDVKEYGHAMVKAGFSIKGKNAADLIEEDIKTFRVGNKVVGISQIFTMDYEDIEADMETFIDKIDVLASSTFNMTIVLITDIEKNGSYVFFDRKSEAYVQEIFSDANFKQGNYVQDLLSRKKQLVPNVMEVLEK